MDFNIDLNSIPSCSEIEEEFNHVPNSPNADVISHEISDNLDVHNDHNEVTNPSFDALESYPCEGMCFGTLEEARKFYFRFASNSGFVAKTRTTNWRTIDGQRVIVSQLFHCNKDGNRGSRVKAPKRRKTLSSADCKARCYVVLDKGTGQWMIKKIRIITYTPN
ncbi:hypothetical protein PIB30_026930 [Stylosanthes scabra]|uniref:FAR1 domain-containing protein n=1 Tax=Stylosanthes scabra TaxID=79078 RepID=A0ABU6Y7Q9_9FABA|nr:hypothetical protein [Stylosanthes scabra]